MEQRNRMEERNRREAYLLYMKISTLQNKLQPKRPIIYRTPSQLLDHIKEIEKKFDKNPGGKNYKMGHSPETYERIFKKLKELREKKKPKQNQVIDTHQSKFMTQPTSKSEMIQNIHEKQQQDVFDKMKEAQSFQNRETSFNINNYFIKSWNNKFEKLKQRFSKEQNAQNQQQNFTESFKCSFGNFEKLDKHSSKVDFQKKINNSVLHYVEYKQYPKLITLIEQFVDHNKNNDIFNCLNIFEQQSKKLKQSNKLEQIKASCEILENNFSQKIRPISNIPYVNVEFGQIMKVYDYLTKDYLQKETGIKSKIQFIDQSPFWALLYMSLRAGFTKDLREYLNNLECEDNYEIIEMIKLIKYQGKNIKYESNHDESFGKSNYIFKDLLLFIFGKVKTFEEFPFDDLQDYLWIWLKRSQYNPDYQSVLETLQNNLNIKKKEWEYSLSKRLSLFSLALQYENVLEEMLENSEYAYQAMVFYYMLLQNQFVDGNNKKLNKKFLDFVIDICDENPLLGLSYLSGYADNFLFAKQMFEVFQNNEKLLNYYFGEYDVCDYKLQRLKRFIGERKLAYFCRYFLNNNKPRNTFFLTVQEVTMIFEQKTKSYDKKEIICYQNIMEQLVAEALKATATQIYQMSENFKENEVPSYYRFTIDYFKKIFCFIHNYKGFYANYDEFKDCNALKSLIQEYVTGNTGDSEFVQLIGEGGYFFKDMTKMQDSTVYVYYEMTVLTLQAMKNILNRLDRTKVKRTALENMQRFLDWIIDFLDESFCIRINYNQIECFDFDAKKAVEKIDSLLELGYNFIALFMFWEICYIDWSNVEDLSAKSENMIQLIDVKEFDKEN